MRRQIAGIALVALSAALTLALASCCVPGGGTSGGSTTTPAEATATVVPPPPAASDVTVPMVLGSYSDEAAALIKAAGLEPVDISIHGPQDPDAGEPGIVYRATPPAGTKVAPGTKVEIRSWWESQ